MDIRNAICSLNIGSAQRAQLILLLLEHKETTFTNVYKRNDTPVHVRNIIEQSGLCVIDGAPFRNNSLTASMIVGRSMNAAIQLQMAQEAYDDYSIRILTGFPKTAAIASVKGGLLPSWKYPPDMRENPLAFRFSKRAYREEIELVRTWMTALEEYVPELYQELYAHILAT